MQRNSLNAKTRPLYFVQRWPYWIFAAALIGLSLFSARSLYDRLEERNDAIRVRAWADVSAGISRIVHELQKERGLSSGYLASSGKRFVSELTAQRLLTDEVLRGLELEIQDLSARSSRLDLQVSPLLNDLRQVQSIRREVSQLTVLPQNAVESYTQAISRLFDFITVALLESGGRLERPLTFITFMQAKELAGQERALLSGMLSANDFSPTRFAAFHRLAALRAERVSSFFLFADDASKQGFRALLGQAYVAEIDAVHQKILAVSEGASPARVGLPTPEVWFALATRQIDAMKSLEDSITLSVKRYAQLQQDQATQNLTMNGLSALGLFLFAGVLLIRFRRDKRRVDKDLHLAAAVFRSSVEAIMIADGGLKIVDINQSFTRITGYDRQEAIGAPTSLLKSGRHGDDFYQGLWEVLLRTGAWEGEVWNRRKNGDIYPALLCIVAVKDSVGTITHYIANSIDLSQHKHIEALLEELRTFDALTGLLSRDAWLSAMDRAIAGARDTDHQFAVLELGLDRFKVINDSLGHDIGDKVLVEVGKRISGCLRRYDVAARPGGDRFSILVEEMKLPQHVVPICEKLLAAFIPPIRAGEHDLQITLSIGIAMYPSDGMTVKDLNKNSESAMYRAKAEGRASYRFYSTDMNQEGARLLVLERMLRQALDREEFSVHYQPQVEALGGRLIGVEALIRWASPDLGNVSPVQFIPVAEDCDLIAPIGEWVLRAACAQVASWRSELGDLPVAVNLSARQFGSQNLLSLVQSVLDETGLPSHLLELEITEGSLITNPAGAADVLRGLQSMGVRIAVDDFGTGYSSLAYLKTFPIDRLKIDRAFVRDLPHDESDCAISRAIVALGLNLKMEVLAEGVETQDQLDFLAQAGCQVIQGYLTGKPMPASALTEALRSGKYRLD